MSLFGSSPDESGISAPPARSGQKSSLFDDEQPSGPKSGSDLFNDEATNGDSPWSMPTPKKASKDDPVRTLLSGANVPESYIDAFDTLEGTEHKGEDGRVKMSGAKKLFEGTGLNDAERDRIIQIVTGGQASSLGRNEFNVLLALIGLSQEGEEASSLDSVDERRRGTCEIAPRACQC